MIAIACAGIYSFASEPLNHNLLEVFLDKHSILSNKVGNRVESMNISVIKIIRN